MKTGEFTALKTHKIKVVFIFIIEIFPINKKSVYLIGKEDKVADIIVNHPTCSRQHAVIQFRKISKQTEDGKSFTYVKPYVMDLESTNGVMLNKERIEAAKYYELKPFDIINLGSSTRDYVVMKVEDNN